jgi:hypothetical protein
LKIAIREQECTARAARTAIVSAGRGNVDEMRAGDSSEPCYGSETIQLLREIKEHPEQGDVAWLSQHGKVYAAVGAA